MLPRYQNFQELVASFGKHPGTTAITIRRFIKIERLTFRELQSRVYQTAHFLESKNIQAGDRIMIVATNSPEWVIVFLSAQILGIVVVTVDATSSPETLERFAGITEPKLVFCSSESEKNISTKYPTMLLDRAVAEARSFPISEPVNRLSGEEGTVIVFTSGTTADPKCAVLSQLNILSNLEATQKIFSVLPSWQFLSVLPLSHMYELTVGCLLPLFAGAGIFYLPRVTPLAISKALKEYHITIMAAVPQIGSLMMQRIERTAEQSGKTKSLTFGKKLASHLPHRWRRIIFKEVHDELGGQFDILAFGGAPVDPDMARKWELMGVKAVQGYGLTETSPILAANVIPKRRLNSQGMMLPNITWKISPAGELLVKGPSVFSGYYKNPKATKEAFTEDGYFKTGDIGKVDKDNWLHIFGRVKFAIVLPSGLKVFPEDIEAVAQYHDSLANICVVGVKTASGETVQAVVASSLPDQEIDHDIDKLNSQLESFQHIDHWVRWKDEDFPRTNLMKVERKTVQAWANHRHLLKTAPTVSHATSDPLIQIIAKLLDRPARLVSEKTKLADIGLDSLRRLALVSIIEEQLGASIKEADINQKTTLHEVRELVDVAPPVHSEKEQPTWPFNPLVRAVGNFLRETICRGLAKIWVGYRTIGAENLQNIKGPVLIAFNHVDYFESPLIYQSLPPKLRNRLAIAGAQDMFDDYPVIAWLGRLTFSAFGLARKEPILPSLKYVADLVDKGWSIAIAPEGQVSLDGQLQKFKSGIGLLAIELSLPVICVSTQGLFGTMNIKQLWPRRHTNVTVKISQPLTFNKEVTYDQATEKIHAVMTELAKG